MVDLLKDLFWASLMLGLPMVVLTFCMVWWALHRGIVESKDCVDDLRKEIDAFGKQRKKQKEKDRDRINPVHGKWFSFGGGFYGLAALYTYLLVEMDEIVDFVTGLPDLVLRLDIGLLIQFFINSLMNFITAITWPVYWMREAESGHFWLWLLVAYAAYWLGLRLAQHMAVRQGLPVPENWLDRLMARAKTPGNEHDQ